MDIKEYKHHGKKMVDLVADYLSHVRGRLPVPQVKPGYLQKMVPTAAPDKPDSWDDVIKDLDKVIMPGLTHWQSPRFFAYYPVGCSYQSLCAEMLSDGINSVGISWIGSPASAELEVVVMDWLVKLLGLPDFYLSSSAGGGGVLQGSASESLLLALLAARAHIIGKVKKMNSSLRDHDIMGRLVVYTSDQANICVQKMCLFAAVKCSVLATDEGCALRGNTLAEAIRKDKERGFIPFFVVATLGTTFTCAFDKLTEIGPICEYEDIWLHIDAAYAGSAFICPEFRSLMAGVEDVSLAKTFESYVKKDSRFEVVNQVQLGLVCFRLKIHPFNKRTQVLLKRIMQDGRIFVVSSESKGIFYIRFVVGAPNTVKDDVIYAWDVIQQITNNYLEDNCITHL